jgi:isopentenyl diphosphate isomerase/L-lactate dehydrogenase-like FMN-dependent dehydrogenase
MASQSFNDKPSNLIPLQTQIPTLASCSFDEMIDAAIPEQTQFLQLYVNADREKTKKIIQHAEKRGVKALFITVDAPQLGRRPKVRFFLWPCAFDRRC